MYLMKPMYNDFRVYIGYYYPFKNYVQCNSILFFFAIDWFNKQSSARKQHLVSLRLSLFLNETQHERNLNINKP